MPVLSFAVHRPSLRSPHVSADAEPFGIAIAPDGAVWATLPSADKLSRIGPRQLELRDRAVTQAPEPMAAEFGEPGRPVRRDSQGREPRARRGDRELIEPSADKSANFVRRHFDLSGWSHPFP